MIKNAILFYYRNDLKLGDYFYNCADYAITLLNQKREIVQNYVVDHQCNSVYIDEVELPKHTEKSIFLIYSHGRINSFSKSDGVPFIQDTISSDICLNEGLVYSNACSVGTKFGKELPLKNASFFGYENDTIADLRYEKIFIECDNWGLHRLVQGDNLLESKSKAIEKFNENIDKVDFFAASSLREARDSIVVYGNDLNKSFF